MKSGNSELFKYLFKYSKNMLIVTDKNNIVTECNDKAVKVFGAEKRDELTGLTIMDLSPKFQKNGRRSEEIYKKYFGYLINKKNERPFNWLCRKLDNTIFQSQLTVSMIPELNVYLYNILDVTNMPEQYSRIRMITVEEELERIQYAVDGSVDKIYFIDEECRIIYANKKVYEFLGDGRPKGRPLMIYDLNPNINQSIQKGIWEKVIKKGYYHFEGVHRDKKGELYPVDIKYSLFRYNNVPLLCVIARDMTEKKQIEKALVESRERYLYIANHDELTKLYNRYAFEKYIGKREFMYPAALAVMDLDGLKLINDAFSHIEGDKVLKIMADGIRMFFTDSFCARIGGDEFAVVIGKTEPEAIEDRIYKLKKYIKTHNKYNIQLSVSIGYCMVDYDTNMEDAFRQAENRMYRRKLIERSSRKDKSMEALLTGLYERTDETKEHCERVGRIARLILSRMGYSRYDELDDILFLGTLHDIGKITIPEPILKKSGSLTKEEWEIIRQHCEAGFKIACNMVDDKKILDAILYHHERWDGKRSPFGLKGEEIPVFARIIAVADAFDAIVTDRPYRKGRSIYEALDEIRKNIGTQFDPEIAETFLKIKISELKKWYGNN